MKEQFAILPELPIVGTLKISTRDGKTLSSIEVVKKQKATELSSFFLHCHKEFESFLTARSRNLEIPLDFSNLTPFQIKVLKKMQKIPYGKVATYKDLSVGMKSKAYQAIGSACGRNPFLLIYPCHRVVGSKDIGGFAHGLVMKRKLLSLEDAVSN